MQFWDIFKNLNQINSNLIDLFLSQFSTVMKCLKPNDVLSQKLMVSLGLYLFEPSGSNLTMLQSVVPEYEYPNQTVFSFSLFIIVLIL